MFVKRRQKIDRYKIKKKIAVLGNTNNSPLRLVEGLRLIGWDADLFVTRKEILHRPESVYPELLQCGYPSWIHDYSNIVDESNLLFNKKKIEELIQRVNRDFELSILNDWAPSLAEGLDHSHFTLLTGSDVNYLANFETLNIVSKSWDPVFKRSLEGRKYLSDLTNMISRQRDGIAASAIVIHPIRGLVRENDAILDLLGITDDLRLELWPCCTTQIKYSLPPKNETIKIFSPSRINISKSSNGSIFTSQDVKGTDILIEGFSNYCKKGGLAMLHLVEKGSDVELLRRMIVVNNLDDRVVWHKEMTTFQLHEMMRSSDIVCDHFNSGPLGLITLDAYALGRPVLANFEVNNIPGRYSKPLPGLSARTANEITQQLSLLSENMYFREKLGAQSRNYAEKYLSCEVMATKLIDRWSNFSNI